MKEYNYSTVEIVFFKKKASAFTQKDFQMMGDSNVKTSDLEREKYIYDCLAAKKMERNN